MRPASAKILPCSKTKRFYVPLLQGQFVGSGAPFFVSTQLTCTQLVQLIQRYHTDSNRINYCRRWPCPLATHHAMLPHIRTFTAYLNKLLHALDALSKDVFITDAIRAWRSPVFSLLFKYVSYNPEPVVANLIFVLTRKKNKNCLDIS